MIDLSHAKRADETDEHRKRRERAARVCRPIFGPETMATPQDRVVRAERHDLSAGVGSATTAEVLTRRAEPTAADALKARTAALPKALQMLVAAGVPITTAELFALVLAHHATNGKAVSLSPGGVAQMLGLSQTDGAKVMTDIIVRGLVLPVTNVFGGTAGYKPDPKYT